MTEYTQNKAHSFCTITEDGLTVVEYAIDWATGFSSYLVIDDLDEQITINAF